MPRPAGDDGDRTPIAPGAATPESVSAVTLATAAMAPAVRFYEALGFRRLSGGPAEEFTSFAVGRQYLNLVRSAAAAPVAWWGRVIFYVSDVDAFYARARAAGLSPDFAPRDAVWGERYFHLTDPDGHQLSFARPLPA